jgi:hypothetical protein
MNNQWNGLIEKKVQAGDYKFGAKWRKQIDKQLDNRQPERNKTTLQTRNINKS